MWGGASSLQVVMKSDGTVWSWGPNMGGQVGDGTTNNRCLPVQVVGSGGVGYLAPVSAIMGGEWGSFAVKPDGTVWSWGVNFNFGLLGNGTTNASSLTPGRVTNLTSVVALGGRGYHTMALKADGTIWSWGRNDYGELGNGVISGSLTGSNVPVQAIGITNPASISGGGFFSLALMPDGTVRSWGRNDHGECGDGTSTHRSLPVQVAGLSNVVSVSGGWFHAMALKSDGTAWAWGQNGNGECGNGTTNPARMPVQVSGLSNVVAVSSGDGHSLALLADGTVWKWGVNQYGEMGNGTIDSGSPAHPLPLQVPGFSNVVLAAARDYHCICVKRDGTVWVWGDNRSGGCGDFSGNPVLSPRLISGLLSNAVIPRGDAFESYPAGFSVVGTNGWYAGTPAMAVVITNGYTNTYGGTFPIPGPHQKALQIDGAATNRFCPSYYTNVWVDLILQSRPWPDATPPMVDAVTNAQFALCVLSNRHLAVWSRTNAPSPGNGWTELPDIDLKPDEYYRLTLNADYAPDANGLFYYGLRVNGALSTNPRPRYATADCSQPWFGEIVAQGRFCLDDLAVRPDKPYCVLTASRTGGGAIAPSGAVIVAVGSTNTFSLTPNPWHSLTSVSVDGSNAAPSGSYTFTNVVIDHAIVAGFAADLAAHNTPKWWLAQANPAWTNDFDGAALTDGDHDGARTWEEYVAGTDPTNPASCLGIQGAAMPVAGTGVVVRWSAVANKFYRLDRGTNLLANPVFPINVRTNVPATPPINTETDTTAVGTGPWFYRVAVQ